VGFILFHHLKTPIAYYQKGQQLKPWFRVSASLQKCTLSNTWRVEWVSTSQSNAAIDIGLPIEHRVDMPCCWVHLLQTRGEYNHVSRTHIRCKLHQNGVMKMSNISTLEANMRENCEKLFGSISTISQPIFVKKIPKTTRCRFLDLLGRALVSVNFLPTKQHFCVVTCLDSRTIIIRTLKSHRSARMWVFPLLYSPITEKLLSAECVSWDLPVYKWNDNLSMTLLNCSI